MPRINEERLKKYRKLAEKGTWEAGSPEVQAFVERAISEGYAIDEYGFTPYPGFFGAPHTKNLDGVDIVCVGVPMDIGVPNWSGTREGPEAIRKWSHNCGPVHHVTKTIPFEICNIADYGDVEFSGLSIETRVENIYNNFLKFKAAGVSTLAVGGEHTMTYPILKAMGKDEPLGVIHLDAHADTAGDIMGEKYNDASVFRRATTDGVIDPERVIQIGIRGRVSIWWDFSYQTGMRVITQEEFEDLGVEKVITEARDIIGDGPCYLSIDADSIDPVYMPGVALPEPFGITARELRSFIRGLRGLDIIGADLAEINPARDPQFISVNVGAALCFEMLCLLAESRVTRSGVMNKTHWNQEPAKETS